MVTKISKNVGQEKKVFTFCMKSLTTRSICLPFILTLCIISLMASSIQFSSDIPKINVARLNRALSLSKETSLSKTLMGGGHLKTRKTNEVKLKPNEPILFVPQNGNIRDQAKKLRDKKLFKKVEKNSTVSEVKQNVLLDSKNGTNLSDNSSPVKNIKMEENLKSADKLENKWDADLHQGQAAMKKKVRLDEVDIDREKFLKSASRYTSWYKKNPRFTEYYSSNITLLPQQTNGVIVLTNYRSGSTFLGELFNQHPDSFYTFEPLIFFTGGCSPQVDLKVSLLENFLKCEFPEISDVFRKIKAPMRKSSVDVECLTDNFCFRKKNKDLCQKDLCPFGRYPKCYKCGPIHLPRVSNKCRAKKMSVLKVIRLCDILQLKPILTNPNLDIKVIHLVRDPRGIESSRLKIDPKRPIVSDSKSTCDRLLHNAEMGSTNSSKLEWLQKRYMRVRYEDLSLEPINSAAEIYKFVGLPFLPEVRKWILTNTQATTYLKKNPYTTKRNSAYTMQAWRKHLTFDQVMEVQHQCANTMQFLGYKSVSSQSELENFDKKLLFR